MKFYFSYVVMAGAGVCFGMQAIQTHSRIMAFGAGMAGGMMLMGLAFDLLLMPVIISALKGE